MKIRKINGVVLMEVAFDFNVNVEDLEYKRNPKLYLEDLAENWINWDLYMDKKTILNINFKEENK